ncbi:hypothetical protein [Asticcacaulis excentricus]|uniref:hypothetical protein n=1 Tax=Asticcacaulis excentricus TaxID=78587 RepID=UPI0015625558|nr:hypothetical protein [Asticcacaulis excentricus]
MTDKDAFKLEVMAEVQEEIARRCAERADLRMFDFKAKAKRLRDEAARLRDGRRGG